MGHLPIVTYFLSKYLINSSMILTFKYPPPQISYLTEETFISYLFHLCLYLDNRTANFASHGFTIYSDPL